MESVIGSSPSAPQVHISPRYLEVQEGDPVVFNCHATGTPLPTLQWTGGPNNLQVCNHYQLCLYGVKFVKLKPLLLSNYLGFF